MVPDERGGGNPPDGNLADPHDARGGDAVRPGGYPAGMDRIEVLDQGFVRLDAALADDLSVANAARVSFGVRKDELDEADRGLIGFLMRERHGSPFEHNAFRFHIRCPIFVAREWFRHRVGCLAGDARITVEDRRGIASSVRIDDLRARFMEGGAARDAVRALRVRVLDEAAGAFTLGAIADVMDSGRQAVFEATLVDGRTLRLTAYHEVRTPDGWQTLAEATGLEWDGVEARATRPGVLLANGVAAVEAPSVLRPHPLGVARLRYVGVRPTYDLEMAGRWPGFVANGVVVHNSFNELSGRYTELPADFYVPAADDVRTQVGKPGAYRFEQVDAELAEETRATMAETYRAAYATYEGLLAKGVAKEVARCVLPVGTYTEFYWTVNARSLMNFLSLRNAEAAQREIRVYASAVEELFSAQMPVTHAAFVARDRTAP